MIGIIDYGAGNLNSVKNAFSYLGKETKIISKPKDFASCEKIVLPGVGSFGYLMAALRQKELEIPLKEFILKEKKPFLGICLGLQALFEKSEESPDSKGLGVLKGEVKKFRNGKVPQVGWNSIIPSEKSFLKEGYAYFVNSYYVVPEDKKIVAADSKYYKKFVCAVQSENILALQFHPEKSGSFGLSILERWLRC
jgi:imidazole glycerol phosphate synthase glutamine amidotransferase subunit